MYYIAKIFLQIEFSDCPYMFVYSIRLVYWVSHKNFRQRWVNVNSLVNKMSHPLWWLKVSFDLYITGSF